MLSRRPRSFRRTDDAGFTLLELLVVMTILVLLTVLGGSVAMNYLGRARADAARLQIDQLETGLELFRLDIGRYPIEGEGLEALIAQPTGLERWQGPYVDGEEILEDPWGTPMVYAVSSDGLFVLTSLGADASPGGEGDAADITN